MNKDKLKDLLSNEDFVKDLFESKSYEAAQAKFKAEGIDVSTDELRTAVTLLKKKSDGELTDEDLEAVSGGIVTEILLFVGVIGFFSSLIVPAIVC